MAAQRPTGFSEGVAADQPPDAYILETSGAQQTSIQLPESGTLWVACECEGQQAEIYIWQQGGSTEPIGPGTQTFTVNPGDSIIFQITDLTQMLKLGWAYVA
jgi:hypothetical protein